MPKRTYILTIQGKVSYRSRDSHIENLLRGIEGSNEDRIEVAFQELGELGEELQVQMELISEEH